MSSRITDYNNIAIQRSRQANVGESQRSHISQATERSGVTNRSVITAKSGVGSDLPAIQLTKGLGL